MKITQQLKDQLQKEAFDAVVEVMRSTRQILYEDAAATAQVRLKAAEE